MIGPFANGKDDVSPRRLCSQQPDILMMALEPIIAKSRALEQLMHLAWLVAFDISVMRGMVWIFWGVAWPGRPLHHFSVHQIRLAFNC